MTTIPARAGKSAAEAFISMSDAHEQHSMRIAETATPWWFRAPSVLLACARVSLLPLDLMIRAAEAMMAIAIVGVFAIGFLWWNGSISDADIVAALAPVGARILDMIEASAN